MALHQPVLVIDDDSMFTKLVSSMLGKRGYLPVISHSMEEALRHGEHPGFVLAITDIYMPGMGGIEGIKALRKRHKNIKIIAMSGGWEDQSAVQALSAARQIGANWALKKPFTADEFNEAIACVLDGKEQEEPPKEPGAAAGPYVVIAEDDPMMGKVIVSTLKSVIDGKFQVLDGGQKVMDILAQDSKPDLIISDLNMPGMDGLMLMRHLGEAKYSGGVCLISGEDESILKSAEKLAQSHNLNVVGSLSKPVTKDDMSAMIGKFRASRAKEKTEHVSLISEDDIRRAVKEGEVEVHYQPKVSTKTRQIKGVEALIRWRHSDLGLIFPGSFIPFAEQNDLINLLTDAVIVSALAEQGEWHKKGLDIKVSINLSTYSLGRLDFPDFLAAQAAKNHITNELVIAEITESGLVEDSVKALEIMSRLRLKGFGLSIDDFGTGHSSLSRLQEAPFSELKIDRSFVAGASEDAVKLAILEASVEMAHKLGVSIVAEGVETKEDWDLVVGLGVDLVQGYYVAKPMPAAELLDWTKQWQT